MRFNVLFHPTQANMVSGVLTNPRYTQDTAQALDVTKSRVASGGTNSTATQKHARFYAVTYLQSSGVMAA
jgi:hypothetical protein